MFLLRQYFLTIPKDLEEAARIDGAGHFRTFLRVMLPLVTIVVATTLAGEAITLNFLLGAGLVLAGVLVGALLPSRTRVAAGRWRRSPVRGW